jgi:hypothetical protein
LAFEVNSPITWTSNSAMPQTERDAQVHVGQRVEQVTSASDFWTIAAPILRVARQPTCRHLLELTTSN